MLWIADEDELEVMAEESASEPDAANASTDETE